MSPFGGANLMHANLSESRFHSCDFENACLNEANLREASIADSLVYGVAAWGVDSADSTQRDLHITKYDLGDARLIDSSVFQLPQNTATVDSIDLALLLHLLTTSPDPTAVLNLMSTRIVLILGRFTEKRKVILDAIRDHLRNSKYCPVMFDFVKPGNRSFTETVSTLAHLARFIIADLSDAKAVIQELHRIVPQNPSIPVQPIVQSDCTINVIIEDLEPYPWFLKTIQYEDQSMLFNGEKCKLTSFAEQYIEGNNAANKRMESNG